MPKANLNNKKVYIALSGGVDSSVAALVLKKQGYDVVGVYMKAYSPPGMPCPWKSERRDAMRVAAKLDIPFKTWDFTKQYKEKVVDYMIAEYTAGRTPNPDIMCNSEIKFGLFFDRALAEGADFIATGHYARIRRGLPKGEGSIIFSLDVNAKTFKENTFSNWRI
jgi:tRNA-specific 2-thiouridylase